MLKKINSQLYRSPVKGSKSVQTFRLAAFGYKKSLFKQVSVAPRVVDQSGAVRVQLQPVRKVIHCRNSNAFILCHCPCFPQKKGGGGPTPDLANFHVGAWTSSLQSAISLFFIQLNCLKKMPCQPLRHTELCMQAKAGSFARIDWTTTKTFVIKCTV